MKRRRRTKAEIKQLEAQIHDVCAADHPVSVRHVFYRMTNPRLPEPVEKSEKGYYTIQQRILLMRRAGRLPYGWIADASRVGWHVPTFTDPQDFVRAQAPAYRFDLWRESDTLVEVWCESRSIAGVIRDECNRLAVSLYPTGGFCSATHAWDAAQEYSEFGAVSIVYVGDYDPAGVLIDRSLGDELRTHTDTPILFHRVAVNEDQIEEYDLPTKPRKATEKRLPDMTETVEAETIPAPILRAMVRGTIESYLSAEQLAYAQVMEEEGQAFLRTFQRDAA